MLHKDLEDAIVWWTYCLSSSTSCWELNQMWRPFCYVHLRPVSVRNRRAFMEALQFRGVCDWGERESSISLLLQTLFLQLKWWDMGSWGRKVQHCCLLQWHTSVSGPCFICKQGRQMGKMSISWLLLWPWETGMLTRKSPIQISSLLSTCLVATFFLPLSRNGDNNSELSYRKRKQNVKYLKQTKVPHKP